MKRVFALVLAMALLTLGVSGALAEGANKPEKLTILIWGSVESQETYNRLIDEYFVKPNGIAVETILVPQTDFYEKLTIMIATDTPPDVTWIPDASFELYVKEGLLADLTELTEDAEYDYNDFVEAQRLSYSKDGAPYAMPFSSPSLVLFYNKTLVEGAGLALPNDLYAKGEWTNEKFYEYALALSNPEKGVYGVNFTRAADWTSWSTALYPVIRSFGGQFWSADGREWLMNSEESVQGLSMFGELMFKYNAHPKPGDSADFFAGQCALYPSLFGDCRKMKNLDFEWDCAPMPVAPNGEYSGWLGTAALGVLESGKNQEWARELVMVLTGKEMMAALQNTYIPPRKSLLASDSFVTGDNGAIPRPSYEHYKQAVLDQADRIQTKDVHLNIEMIDDVIMTNLEAFYMQAVDAKECLQMMADEAQAYMLP